MKKLLAATAAIALLALSICLLSIASAVRHLDREISQTMATVRTLQPDIARLAADSDRLVNKAEHTTEQQRLYFKIISHDTALSVQAANRLIQHTDAQLNDPQLGLFALLRSSIGSNAVALEDTTDTLRTGSAAALLELRQSLHGLNLLANNPAAATSLANLQEASEQLSRASSSLNAASQPLVQASADLQGFMHRVTRPASTLKSLLWHLPGWTLAAIHF